MAQDLIVVNWGELAALVFLAAILFYILVRRGD